MANGTNATHNRLQSQTMQEGLHRCASETDVAISSMAAQDEKRGGCALVPVPLSLLAA
jgi:hypothetical protein